MNQPTERRATVCNADRLLPRGQERKRGLEGREGREKKRLAGSEEMERLRTLVPSLRESSGRLSQVDIIEETISYIDSLHRRVAERMVSMSSSYPDLTLGHVEEAERMSQELGNSEEQFRERLAAFSQPSDVIEIEETNTEDRLSTNQITSKEEKVGRKVIRSRAPSDAEEREEEPDKLSAEQRRAIEAVKSTFVTLISSSVPDQAS